MKLPLGLLLPRKQQKKLRLKLMPQGRLPKKLLEKRQLKLLLLRKKKRKLQQRNKKREKMAVKKDANKSERDKVISFFVCDKSP